MSQATEQAIANAADPHNRTPTRRGNEAIVPQSRKRPSRSVERTVLGSRGPVATVAGRSRKRVGDDVRQGRSGLPTGMRRIRRAQGSWRRRREQSNSAHAGAGGASGPLAIDGIPLARSRRTSAELRFSVSNDRRPEGNDEASAHGLVLVDGGWLRQGALLFANPARSIKAIVPIASL